MRPTAALLLLFAWAPVAAGDWGHGQPVGVDAYVASAGDWDLWYLEPAPGTHPRFTWINLTWPDFPPVGVDYDLTLWHPGAVDDGRLTQDEVVAASWTRHRGIREEQIVLPRLPPARYVVTVEPIQALGTSGERYTLQADHALLTGTWGVVPGVKHEGWLSPG